MHPSLAAPSSEDEQKLKIHHRFYFVKPDGEKQQFHEQKMYMYKTQVYEEILVTIDGEYFKANPQLVSEDDTLKIVVIKLPFDNFEVFVTRERSLIQTDLECSQKNAKLMIQLLLIKGEEQINL
ncbi:hypothetical protein TYRP_017805 [Tyrophagus putrescentiae]|nr:hypothetical protein TYRP_017805 [Tyrophagus putrescentiae]